VIISIYWILSSVIVRKNDGLLGLQVTGDHVRYANTCICEMVPDSDIVTMDS